MRKTVLCVLLAALIGGGALAAQTPDGDRSGRPHGPKWPTPAETTLSGTLVWEQGHMALKAADGVYTVHGLQPLVGFADGVREGAAVTVKGWVRTGPMFKAIRANAVTVGGKDYQLAPPDSGPRPPFGPPPPFKPCGKKGQSGRGD